MQGLIDTTLREGAQAVGVRFTPGEKKAIFHQLVALGIEEVELGLAAAHPLLADLCRHCHDTKGQTRIALWSRCHPDDIKAAARLHPDVLSLSIPASDLHLRQRLGRDRQWALTALRDSIEQARGDGFDFISVGLEDAGRADPGFLEELAATAARSGARRIRLADTVGTATPAKIQRMVGRLKKNTRLAVGIHAHNDFGMASANTIAALEAGADWGDVSVLGLGERAGMARLEEVAGFLALQKTQPRYRADLLKPLSEMVSRAAGRPIGPHRPVIGERIFACETGLHLQGLLRAPDTYEPFDPRLVGSERQLLFGTKVGRGAVQELLAGQGLQRPDPQDASLANLIRQHSRSLERPLSMREATELTGPNHEPAPLPPSGNDLGNLQAP